MKRKPRDAPSKRQAGKTQVLRLRTSCESPFRKWSSPR